MIRRVVSVAALVFGSATAYACTRYVSDAFDGGGYAPPVPEGVFQVDTPQAACAAVVAHFVGHGYPSGSTLESCDAQGGGVVAHWSGGNYYPASIVGSCTPPAGFDPATAVPVPRDMGQLVLLQYVLGLALMSWVLFR